MKTARFVKEAGTQHGLLRFQIAGKAVVVGFTDFRCRLGCTTLAHYYSTTRTLMELLLKPLGGDEDHFFGFLLL
jgi:hypothetical protein